MNKGEIQHNLLITDLSMWFIIKSLFLWCAKHNTMTEKGKVREGVFGPFLEARIAQTIVHSELLSFQIGCINILHRDSVSCF